MSTPTRSLRHRRFLVSTALSGLVILAAHGAAGPATGVTPPTVTGTSTTPTATSAGVTPVTPSTTNPPTGINSAPQTSAGTFPNDITRFSQSSAVNPAATPTPSTTFTPSPQFSR